MERDIGEWECKTPGLWTYHLPGVRRPYGYVVQYRDAERFEVDWSWNAILTVEGLDDDRTIAEHVPFDAATAAIEEHARQQDG